MFIDLHLDLSMNAMEWNRDLRLPVDVINEREAGMTDKPDRGRAVVSFPELKKGDVKLVVATQIARYVVPGSTLQGWNSPEQAWAQTQAQLAWYREMERQGFLKMVRNAQEVKDAAGLEEGGTEHSGAIPYILSLEGADSLVDPGHLDTAYAYGLRAIGPAHYGPGRYANGTNATGKMGRMGVDLLKRMDELRMILDVTHLCDDAFWQAMDMFKGPVWASHNNCRAIVDHNRQFSDRQLRLLIERGAVVGAAFDAWMVVPGWEKGRSTPAGTGCNMERVADHIDHICQLAGNALHVSIGTDLDGGFGREQCPYDVETISDVNGLYTVLEARGYSEQDVQNIMWRNAYRFICANLQG